MAKVTMPQLGESVAEGTIGKWLKQPGDHVAKYEPLLEVITDKVNAEVPSPFEGTLREILAEEGATVPNDAEIAIIETADEGRARRGSPHRRPVANGPDRVREARWSEPGRLAPPDPTTAAVPPRQPAAAPAAPAAARPRPRSPRRPAATGDADARMTPAVRRLLREHDLSPAQITGTGGGGRITREDVLAVVEAMRTGSPGPERRPGRRPHLTRARRDPGRTRPPRPRPARRSCSRRAPTKSSCR